MRTEQLLVSTISAVRAVFRAQLSVPGGGSLTLPGSSFTLWDHSYTSNTIVILTLLTGLDNTYATRLSISSHETGVEVGEGEGEGGSPLIPLTILCSHHQALATVKREINWTRRDIQPPVS